MNKKLLLISALLFSFNGWTDDLWIPSEVYLDSQGNITAIVQPYNRNPKFLSNYQSNEKHTISLECKGSKESSVAGKITDTDSFDTMVYIETIKNQEGLDDIPIKIEAKGSTFVEHACKASQREFSCIYHQASQSESNPKGITHDGITSIRINRLSGKYSYQSHVGEKYGDGRVFQTFYEGYCSLLSDQKF